MERSRTEWLRSFAIEQDELLVKYGIIFAVRSIKLDYLKPARFNQQLQVSTQVVHQGRASITFHQQVFRMEPADVVENNRIILCEGQIKIACLDADSFQPKAIPAVLPITTEDKH
jgi:acyl-CoA thioester hydrolase